MGSVGGPGKIVVPQPTFLPSNNHNTAELVMIDVLKCNKSTYQLIVLFYSLEKVKLWNGKIECWWLNGGFNGGCVRGCPCDRKLGL